jgi:hypothetical protein
MSEEPPVFALQDAERFAVILDEERQAAPQLA